MSYAALGQEPEYLYADDCVDASAKCAARGAPLWWCKPTLWGNVQYDCLASSWGTPVAAMIDCIARGGSWTGATCEIPATPAPSPLPPPPPTAPVPPPPAPSPAPAPAGEQPSPWPAVAALATAGVVGYLAWGLL